MMVSTLPLSVAYNAPSAVRRFSTEAVMVPTLVAVSTFAAQVTPIVMLPS